MPPITSVADRRGTVRAPSIANYVMNISKDEKRTKSPSSRQLIEFALPNERQSGGAYAATESSYWTGKTETATGSADPFEASNSYDSTELSAEGPRGVQVSNPKPQVAAAKHTASYPPITAPLISKTPKKHPVSAPSPVVAMPTPKPFVMRRHKSAALDTVLPDPVISNQRNNGARRLLKDGSSSSLHHNVQENKGKEEASKRVYSLGDNGKLFV